MMLVNTPRTLFNPFPGSRPLILGRKRLSQNETNRLLDIPVYIILLRAQALILSPFQSKYNGQNPFNYRNEDMASVQKLQEISQNPTSEEIQDLAVIDSFFWPMAISGQPAEIVSKGRRPQVKIFADTFSHYLCDPDLSPDETILALSEKGVHFYPEQKEAAKAAKSNPFYCPPQFPIDVPQSIASFYSPNIALQYFNLYDSNKWGDVKSATLSAIEFMKAAIDYPFPRPLSIMPQVWFYKAQSRVIEMTRLGMIISEPAFRFWITNEVLYLYDECSDEILSNLEKQAKRSKRMALTRKIVMTATFAVISLGLASALVGMGLATTGFFSSTAVAKVTTGVIQEGLSIQEKREAAQALEKAAKQFDEDDAAFAQEVRQNAEILDSQVAEAERRAALSQEEQDALSEGQGNPDYGPDTEGYRYDVDPKKSNSLAIAGGIAVVGIGALILALS